MWCPLTSIGGFRLLATVRAIFLAPFGVAAASCAAQDWPSATSGAFGSSFETAAD